MTAQQTKDNVSVAAADISLPKNIVAITACAAGVAHTYMAADSLKQEAEKLGINIHVETQGTIGAENQLTAEQINNADLVIIAADVKIDQTRFTGKKLFQTGVNPAIKSPGELIRNGWKDGQIWGKKGTQTGVVTFGAVNKKGILSHLMTGISWMIPMVIAGGILMAIANLCAFQNEYIDQFSSYSQAWVLGTRPLPQFLQQIGGVAFKLMIPVFAGFVAYSIGDRPAVVPAMLAGWIINDNQILNIHFSIQSSNQIIQPGAGFIGAIVVGLLTGYLVSLLKIIRWPKIIQPIVPLMILPIAATFIMCTFVMFVIGKPIANWVVDLFTDLTNIEQKYKSTGVIIALVVALMISFDLGGPLNKTALVFATFIFYQSLTIELSNGGTFWDADFGPQTAVQAAISVPPLGMWLSTVIFKNRYPKNQRVMGTAAFGTGIVGITEGSIPFAAADPLRVIPANMIGSAVAAVLVTVWNVKFAAGLGSPLGTFLGYIKQPSAPYWPMAWILAIVIGIIITAVIAGLLKPKIKGQELEILKQEKIAAKKRHKNYVKFGKTLFTHPDKAWQLTKKFTKKYAIIRKKAAIEYWTWIYNNVKNYFIGWYKTFKRYYTAILNGIKKIFKK